MQGFQTPIAPADQAELAFWERMTRLTREFAHDSEGRARRRFIGRPEFGFKPVS